MLVSLGAAMFVMIPLQAEGDSTFATTNALSRTIQGVTTGVGFIGAGLILQQTSTPNYGSTPPKVKGLTTAASIWTAAALGAAIGAGLWEMGLIGAFLTLITLSGVKRVHRYLRGLFQRRGQPGSTPLLETESSDDDEY